MILTQLYKSLFNYKSFKDKDIVKGNIIDMLDNITINARANVLKNYIMLSELTSENTLTPNQTKKLTSLFKQLGIKKSGDPEKAIHELKSFLTEVITGLEDIKPLVMDMLPDTIDVEVMSSREMGIIGTITILSSIVFSLEDLSLYILYTVEDEKFIYNLKNREFIKDIAVIKQNYKELNGEVKSTIKDLRKLDDEVEVSDENSFGLHAKGFDKKFSVGTSGFLGSPIFIMRRAWEDFKIERIEAMKNKKSLFELKLTNLRNKNQGGGDLKIENAIEYYEERITKYEREIKAFEEDID